MAAPDLIINDNETQCGTVSLATNPFVSNQYHFGMLLGVDDLEVEQAYHRGKQWLHNAWLHGIGTVWGLRVDLDVDKHELIVNPGLAIDGHGRELNVTDRMCIDLLAWFKKQPAEDLAVVEGPDDGHTFTVVVELCHDGCLERPVPSISEPCDAANFATAYSRAVERGLPRLRAGKAAPEGPPHYPRLRQFFGQKSPTDTLVREALNALDDAEPVDRPAICVSWFRRLAAADTMDIEPGDTPYSPVTGDGCVVLAEVQVHFRGEAAEMVLVGDGDDPTKVDNSVRPSHVRTRTIQELLCHSHDPASILTLPEPDPSSETDESGTNGDPAEAVNETPQVIGRSVVIDSNIISMHFTHPLASETVTKNAFQVSVLRTSGWADSTVRSAVLSEDGLTVTLNLTGSPTNRPIRIVAEGAGPRPIVGTNGAVLSGNEGQPTVETGADGVAMIVADPATDEE